MLWKYFGRLSKLQEGQIKETCDNDCARIIGEKGFIERKLLWVELNKESRSKLSKESVNKRNPGRSLPIKHKTTNPTRNYLFPKALPTTAFLLDLHPTPPITLPYVVRQLNLPKRRIQGLQTEWSAPRPRHLFLQVRRQVRGRLEIEQDEWQGHAILPQRRHRLRGPLERRPTPRVRNLIQRRGHAIGEILRLPGLDLGWGFLGQVRGRVRHG